VNQGRVKPILVMMSWRGGKRLERCLDSIGASKHHFKRIILSITSTRNSADFALAQRFQSLHPGVEVICTNRELPTMEHQSFWVTYLEQSGVQPTDWIYWLAYDDQVRTRGIEEIIDESGDWPLQLGTAYFGPWAMRHEQPDQLWNGDPSKSLESWTSFPKDGPTKLPVLNWIEQQLLQPTYMQMSGSVCTFQSYLQIRDARPKKTGPMRIEMATAAATCNQYVAEFPTPVSIIYGRSNSDRANYGSVARNQDLHLITAILRRTINEPSTPMKSLTMILNATKAKGSKDRVTEDWRVRGLVSP
jgi:hypothetical protein